MPFQCGEHRSCSYSGCASDDKTPVYRIKTDKQTGGRDWSAFVDKYLCTACIKRYKKKGTLERTGWTANKPQDGEALKCTYEHCAKPEGSSNYFQIEEGRTAGGQDWTPLVGEVLCAACFDRYRSRGTLERAHNKPLAGAERRCTYEHCDKPCDGIKFYQIEEGSTAGGQDWSSVAGSVLCKSCYMRFLKRGTLESAHNRPLVGADRRCTNEHCDRPEESRQFLQIEGDSTAGGQDWSPIAGKVLCVTCYKRYTNMGTLERSSKKARTTAPVKRCTYNKCLNPSNSSTFHKVEEGEVAGGQDWSSVLGMVLCDACHNNFLKKGTLERTDFRKCSYEHCEKPEESRQFYSIEEGRTAGKRDWSSLAGQVLCEACYKRYYKKGTIEREVNRPLAPSAKKCMYDKCKRPEQSSKFHQIREGRQSGGMDWTSVVGKVLCDACFHCYKNNGTLDRAENRPAKKQKTQLGNASPAAASSDKPGASLAATVVASDKAQPPVTGGLKPPLPSEKAQASSSSAFSGGLGAAGAKALVGALGALGEKASAFTSAKAQAATGASDKSVSDKTQAPAAASGAKTQAPPAASAATGEKAQAAAASSGEKAQAAAASSGEKAQAAAASSGEKAQASASSSKGSADKAQSTASSASDKGPKALS